MKVIVAACLSALFAVALAFPVSKQHAVAFGRWTTVQYIPDSAQAKLEEMKVRPLLVDGRIKEFTTGMVHEITERTFVVQKAFRVNDRLPHESGAPRWRWERGPWLLVDRVSGRVQPLDLSAFDPYYSEVRWYRDYAAYCGFSEDLKQAFAIVVELGKRKPLLKKALGEKNIGAASATGCTAPAWQRDPARATFQPAGEAGFVFVVRSHAVELAMADQEDAEGESVRPPE